MRCLLFLCSLSISFVSRTQNLVPNGDLETYSQCPDYVSQIDRAVGWSRPTNGTSDYLNACLGVPFSESVPDNEFGYQAAHSGNGYAGFYCFYETESVTVAGDDDHEYVTHALAAPLIPGEAYAVEFFVSLADVSHYAVNDIGALLSTQIPTRTDELAITATPQIANTTLDMLDEKNGWMRIHGCFIADSAFAYITIGNFHVGPATVFTQVPTDYPLTWYSYYYVDDVSVQHMEHPELGPDVTSCGAVTLAVLDPVAGASYFWSTGQTGTSIVVEVSGDYSVASDMEGCGLADTVQVTMAAPIALVLPPDTAADLCVDHTVVITAGTSPPNAELLWSTGATTPSIGVDEPGVYTVLASGPGLCPASASIEVTDLCQHPVFAPDAFTPDGDGINDGWWPVWRANAGALLELTVFDRWGSAVFTAMGLDAVWNGEGDHGPLPGGIYAWYGRARDPATGFALRLSGHVVLIR